MDFRQIKQFVVLATELNYAGRRAAAHDPAAAQHRHQAAGDRNRRRVFERDRQGVRLTVAGIAFLDEARRLLDGAESALQAARDAAQGRGRAAHLLGA